MSLSGMVEIQAGAGRPRRSISVQVQKTAWIPASAGPTETRVDFQSTILLKPFGLESRLVEFLIDEHPFRY